MVYFHLSHAKDTYSFFLFNECTVAESWIHMCEKLEKYEEIDLQNFLGSQMTLKGRREKKPLLFVKVQPTKFTATRAFFYLFSEVFCPNPLRYSIRNQFLSTCNYFGKQRFLSAAWNEWSNSKNSSD